MQELGVKHCVAFVVGREAEGNEDILERWLDSGYELGNHTFHHQAASTSSLKKFEESVRRCDALLRSLGAMNKQNSKWFRFPFLDRGSDPYHRRELAAIVHEMGYTVSHASLQFYDHPFEELLVKSRQRQDTTRERAIAERYAQVAEEAVAYQIHRIESHYGAATPHIAFCHFGPVSESYLPGILTRLVDKGAVWCKLSEAQGHSLFKNFDEDYHRSGFVTDTIPDQGVWRLRRRAIRLFDRIKYTNRSVYGPRWPYLTN